MTGYGSDTYSNDQFILETEVRSLNSRFLDLSVRLPKELNQNELIIREYVKSKIIRGKVSVNFNLTFNNTLNDENLFDEKELAKSIGILEKIKKSLNSDEKITINQLLQIKEKFLLQSEQNYNFEADILVESLAKALDSLVKMRAAEGAELKKDLELRIENIAESLDKIEKLSETSAKEYFEKFKEKAKKLYDEFINDEDRFMIELGILSEKHDVTEECIRLRSHIKLFNETMIKSQDVGRKLNFICQEMNREINTINSKSISSEISHLGINIKEELEKIREQVQNIE
jgi:uncharacterized protein (TIGR00255 family)